jgi:hypothetical protein
MGSGLPRPPLPVIAQRRASSPVALMIRTPAGKGLVTNRQYFLRVKRNSFDVELIWLNRKTSMPEWFD